MDDTATLLPGVHRSIRRLDGDESAFPGVLVTDGELMRIRVDTASVADQLWTFAAAEHVAGVRDVVRRHDGHDALLPWCADTVERFLGRRAAAERPLLPGEVVTLIGSVLRGTVEAAEAGATAEVRGRWWLADDSRPLFVPGEGVACSAAGAEIIASVRAGCTDRALDRLLTEIGTGMLDTRVVVRSMDRWEHELTELAAPRALDRQVFPPERVSAIEMHRALLPVDARRVNEQRSARTAMTHRVIQRFAQRSALMRDWLREHRPRLQRRAGGAPRERDVDAGSRSGRGRMLLVGGCAAAAVLTAGLMWPSGEEDSSAAVTSKEIVATQAPATAAPAAESSSPDAEVSEESEETDAAAPVPDDADDIAQTVTALLTEIAACALAEDLRCEGAVVEGAGESVIQRLTGADAARELTPIEDYGDIAVIRLGRSGDHGEQMLVLVSQDDEWLVRDVYDVADQPSGEG
ncbi:hypothetical protein [Microbacterium alcoholitolerans]|uniref:hypothetical protein n=1 Tax=unclassified Microbacterium TaxID=2609290 RepID=UPI003D162540